MGRFARINKKQYLYFSLFNLDYWGAETLLLLPSQATSG